MCILGISDFSEVTITKLFCSSCPANVQALSTAPIPGFTFAPDGPRLLAEVGQIGDTFSEDCLTLNVWTKPQTGEKAKAVLFWIYGGGKYFMDLYFPLLC